MGWPSKTSIIVNYNEKLSCAGVGILRYGSAVIKTTMPQILKTVVLQHTAGEYNLALHA